MSKIASGLHLKQSRHVDDSGRAFVRFVPEFVPNIRAQGFLTFACYDAWEDDKAGLHIAMNEALANARMVMNQFAESFKIRLHGNGGICATTLTQIIKICESYQNSDCDQDLIKQCDDGYRAISTILTICRSSGINPVIGANKRKE